MLPPYTYAAGRLAEERAKDAMREGEHARLLRMARPVKRGPMDRLMAKLGGLLITQGEQLRARHRARSPQQVDWPLEARQ